MTATVPELERFNSAADDELDHYYCCDENLAMCGSDLSAANETEFPDDSPSLCIVCVHTARCKVCGEEYVA